MPENKNKSNSDIRKRLFQMTDEIRRKQEQVTVRKSVVTHLEGELIDLQEEYDKLLFELFPNT